MEVFASPSLNIFRTPKTAKLISCPKMKRSERYPLLAKQWSPNNSLEMDDPGIKGDTQIIWVCEKGHEWATVYKARANSRHPGCPICSGRSVIPKDSLQVAFPKLTEMFFNAGNTDDALKINPGSPKKYEWKCKEGHIFKASPRQVTLSKLEIYCPQCNSFGFNCHELMAEWDFAKNSIDPYSIGIQSNKRAWWKCSEGHEWDAIIYSRTSLKTGCPYCAGKRVTDQNSFATKNPEKARFWDTDRNKLTANEVTANNNKKFFFICEKGHSFSSQLNNVMNGKWCPYCSCKKPGYGNTLDVVFPEIAAEWNHQRNDSPPSEYVARSNKKVWWKCPQGHEWTTTIASRVAGSGCGVCANRVVGSDNSLAAMYPNIAKEIDFGKTDIDPASVYSKSWIGVWWNCKHGHSWKAAIRSRTEAGTGCPFCTSQTSLPEIRIFAELKELFPTAVNRQKLEGLELDVSIPELNVAIEYDGAYFHADKDAKDEEKKVAITKAGYLLIRLREKPLPCGEHDIPVEPKHEAIEKSHILEVLKIIAAKYPNTSKLQHRYSCYDEFLAEE